MHYAESFFSEFFLKLERELETRKVSMLMFLFRFAPIFESKKLWLMNKNYKWEICRWRRNHSLSCGRWIFMYLVQALASLPRRKVWKAYETACHHTYRFSSSSLACFLCEQGWLPLLELCLASVSWTCSRRGHLRCWWLSVYFDLVFYLILIDLGKVMERSNHFGPPVEKMFFFFLI